MDDEDFDCTRCGACCRAGEGSALITAEDLVRWRRAGRHDLADNVAPGHFGEVAFPTDAEGACAYLSLEGGRSLCQIYPDRASVCHDFEAGSWQCREFRRDARARGWSLP